MSSRSSPTHSSSASMKTSWALGWQCLDFVSTDSLNLELNSLLFSLFRHRLLALRSQRGQQWALKDFGSQARCRRSSLTTNLLTLMYKWRIIVNFVYPLWVSFELSHYSTHIVDNCLRSAHNWLWIGKACYLLGGGFAWLGLCFRGDSLLHALLHLSYHTLQFTMRLGLGT